MITVGTLNVLAEAYTQGDHGSFAHVESGLLRPGVRHRLWPKIIKAMNLDVLAMQEVERGLALRLLQLTDYQVFWSPKENSRPGHIEPDGCLLLVRKGIEVEGFRTHYFSDETGHVAQTWRIRGVQFGNSHLKFYGPGTYRDIQVEQVLELLGWMGEGPGVLLGDFNDWPRPGGPILEEVVRAEFTNG